MSRTQNFVDFFLWQLQGKFDSPFNRLDFPVNEKLAEFFPTQKESWLGNIRFCHGTFQCNGILGHPAWCCPPRGRRRRQCRCPRGASAAAFAGRSSRRGAASPRGTSPRCCASACTLSAGRSGRAQCLGRPKPIRGKKIYMMTSLFDVLLDRPRHQSHGGQPWMTSLADDTQTDGYSHTQGSHEWRSSYAAGVIMRKEIKGDVMSQIIRHNYVIWSKLWW